MIQWDSNPDPQNQVELEVNASIHWTTSVNPHHTCLREVYIPSQWFSTMTFFAIF